MSLKQQRTILIVDDTAHDRETYRRYLQADQQNSYIILEEELAEDALALCRTITVDGILLDFLLPDLDGLQFLMQLKMQVGDKSPPVIMITGQGNEAVAAKAIKSGAEDYLIKRHITPDSLRLAINGAIENTELRRQLQASEERFHTSVENMLDCFGIYSAIRNESGQIIDFRIDYLNAAALASNQMSPKDIGRFLCEVFPNKYQSQLFAEYCQVVETGNPLVRESQIYSDVFGSEYLTKFFDIRISKLGDGMVVCWRDVTARQEAEIARRQQIERERIVNQIAQQIRQSLDLEQILNTTVTEVRKFLQTDRVLIFRFQTDGSGVVVTESVGSGWNSILHTSIYDPCFMETYLEIYHQGLVTSKSNILDKEINPCYRELLNQFQVRANLVVPILQDDKLWGLLIAHHCTGTREWHFSEISLLQQLATQVGIAIKQSELYQQMSNELIERQRTEAALRQSESLFRGVFESNIIGIILWDNTGKLLNSNETFCRMIGYSKEEFIAGEFHYQDITPPEYQEIDEEKFQELQKTGCCTPFMKEYICKNGKRLPVLLAGAYLPGSRNRGVAFIVDISEQKQLEEERKQLLLEAEKAREEAEIANRSKDRFLAIVSHELRAPLTTIMGWSNLLRTRKFDAAIVETALETIERNAQVQNKIIDDLLDVSRMIRGNLQISLNPVNVTNIIEVTISSLQLLAEDKGVKLESKIADRNVQIIGDINRLQQIITNLLTNAIKFTPHGGRVEVELSVVTKLAKKSSSISENGYAQIRVTDTGKGITADFLPHVFEYYRQEDSNSNSSSSKDGVGLGLAIVYHLVELHNGKITATSPGEGKGATFTVSLPLLKSEN
ncbi:ATP-binding protein [Aerosakkonemataceae cyanobacterium BLCC-F154]|uniref:histidine kinase n=1 Tax=Floridaenema fluviatile BLCC-F154 TaxID=3153640 RepID=A0ABV4YED8_9CYAN